MTLVEAADSVADLLLRVAIPLYNLDDNKRPWLCGTGFIVKAPTAHYLVSAAHVLDDAKKRGLFFYIGPKLPRHVGGPLLRSSDKENRDLDPFDIVIVRLEEGEMPPYPEVEKEAVDVSCLRPGERRSDKQFLVLGFPQSKSHVSASTREVKVTSCPYRASSIDLDRYEALGISTQSHVAIHLDREDGRGPDGEHRNFPHPAGMSGGPIFELWDEEAEGDREVFPLVAVGIEYRKNERVLIGTDVAVVLDMIHQFESGQASPPAGPRASPPGA